MQKQVTKITIRRVSSQNRKTNRGEQQLLPYWNNTKRTQPNISIQQNISPYTEVPYLDCIDILVKGCESSYNFYKKSVIITYRKPLILLLWKKVDVGKKEFSS